MRKREADNGDMPRTAGRAWLIALGALILIGLGACIYLSVLHWQVRYLPGHTSFCAVSEEVNCDTVALSKYSVVASVPVSTWGILFFTACLVLIAWGWFSRRPPWPWVLLGAMNMAAVAATAFLFLACDLIIGSFCIMCLILYSVNMLGALVCVLGQRRVGIPPAIAASLPLLGVALGSAAFVLLEPETLAPNALGLGLIGGISCLAIVLLNLKRAGNNLAEWMAGLHQNLSRLFLRPVVGYAMLLLAAAGVTAAVLVTHALYPETPTIIEGGVEGLHHGKTEAGHPWIGAERPLVTLVEYSDYECPFCRRAHEEVRALVRKNRDWLRLVHVHMPLDQSCNPSLRRPFHQHACASALATICADEQGAFWNMNDRLFLRRGGLDAGGLGALAGAMGLDERDFRSCIKSERASKILADNLAEAQRLNLKTATPTFRIGSRVLVGVRGLKEQIMAARKAAEPKQEPAPPPGDGEAKQEGEDSDGQAAGPGG